MIGFYCCPQVGYILESSTERGIMKEQLLQACNSGMFFK